MVGGYLNEIDFRSHNGIWSFDIRFIGKLGGNTEGIPTRATGTVMDPILEHQCLLGPQGNGNVLVSPPGESWLDMSSHRMLQATDAGRGRVLKIAQSTCCRTLCSHGNLQQVHDTSGRMRLHSKAK
jgi:hypothetical protein